MASHNGLRLGLIITSLFIFAVMLAMNGLASTDIGIFVNSTGDASDYFFLEITPAGWTFSIWGVIYAWQVLFMAYVLTTLCRQREDSYLYVAPDVWPPAIFVLYIINNLLNVAWLLLFDRFLINWALPALLLTPATLYACLFLSARRLTALTGTFKEMNLRADIWMIRLFVHNAFGIYATWTTIASLLNLAIVLTYTANLLMDISCTVSLIILTLELVFWFCLDIFLLDKWVRYLLTPYLVVVFALAGSIFKNWDPTKRNSIFTAVLISVAAVALVTKIVTMIYRHMTRPLIDDKPSQEKNALE